MNEKEKKKLKYKDQIIKRQTEKIDSLTKIISDLEIDCSEKDKIIDSISELQNDMEQVIKELKEKDEEYNKLISELLEMRKIMDQEVFKGKWKLIKLLLK